MKRSTSGSINMLKESSCHSFLKMQIFFLMFFILISLSFQEILQFPSTEHSILLSLKQHWSDSKFLQSWDLKFSPCGWSGVTCIYGISIVKLDLEEKRITGTIPSTICQLKNLTVIDLSNNNISGAIPASLRDCSKLQHLDLSNNSSTGQIPGHLFQLQYLHHLSLSHNHLSGAIPDAINLVSLSDMDLSHNQLSGSIPKGLGDLPRLYVLDLSHNQLSGNISENLDHLRRRIKTLRLCSNKFKGRSSVEFLRLTFEENCFDESNLCSNNSFPGLPSCSSGDKVLKFMREKHFIIIIPAVGVGVAIQLVWIFYMVRKHCSKMKNQNSKEDLRFITFHKLKLTKEDIVSSLKDENVIGHGGSGKVYRMAINQTGDTFAVKSIGHDKRLGEKFPKDFLAEIRIIGLIRHRNIVKLFCCISSTDKNLLVYEYFEKQSLDKWLRRKKRAVSPGQSSIPSLDWCSSRTLLHAPRLHSTHHS
ncbi:receptor-like protein kinase HSL1 isoform X1 [Lycium barbarum]|uniref:receptor-like protein kinase HSL1 isoform X1 n=1 Tax=Lycium barbarum TaxID=112863 RepID=UPI00293E82DC|nr:receptor-like protein kinase HSL1 isoform X1 [Lycium barbarum]XP_060208370.1 receptor-like protein kinase HSL1 isoform X1 [Lycium barbarum]XP_060208371.1 receptor-like protein kinase HSL1 isoform X1 [Lycium barbarum]XP_060208372.1 receptor-like protein kinase HSL1 isoform X1 [Lycium barbarum]XP_060208373.1 receptor-like protein kinase HSL1 isoform X1 [Lycium barbarum]